MRTRAAYVERSRTMGGQRRAYGRWLTSRSVRPCRAPAGLRLVGDMPMAAGPRLDRLGHVERQSDEGWSASRLWPLAYASIGSARWVDARTARRPVLLIGTKHWLERNGRQRR
jgi:hypothetical protein